MKRIFLLLLFLPLQFLLAQDENSGDLSEFLPKFFFEILDYKGEDTSKTQVDVYVEVPYIGIQFLKSPQGFTANYSVTVSVFDQSKANLITEKMWNETVNSKTFENTLSKFNYYISLKSLMLDPGMYFMRIEVVDKDSEKNYVREELVEIRDLTAPVSVSDILLVKEKIRVGGEDRIIPNISKNVAAQKEGLNFLYEIYADTPKTVNTAYVILDKDRKEIFKQNSSVNLRQGKNEQLQNLQNTELEMGIYHLAIIINDENGKEISNRTKRFFSRWAGLPSSVRDLDKAIDQMIYIAKSGELKNIKKAENQQEKSKRFMEFWQAKDPTPNTEQNEVFEEYYRRIAFANEKFKNYQEGWRTDMGMVFITLGAPNNIERHPFEFDSKPYEVWDYYDINQRFIFVDQTGFGDYRLLNPVYGNWWKYRQ